MLIIIVGLLIAATITYFLMKKGKIADANNNNIPDAIESKIESIKEVVKEVKEVVKEAKATRGKGMREVVIVKTNPTKKPTIKKLMVKGNERITAGGNVKRAKVRQTSQKKNSLGR